MFKAEQAVRSKPVSSALLWFLIWFLSWFPLMMEQKVEDEINHILPRLLLVTAKKIGSLCNHRICFVYHTVKIQETYYRVKCAALLVNSYNDYSVTSC